MLEIGARATQALDLGALRQRLSVDADASRAADRALWVLGGGFIVVGGLLPLFAGLSDVLLVQQSLYLGLLALSLNLLVNTTGLVSFGHAVFYGFGAYMVALPFAHLGWSALAGLGLAPVIGAVGAFVIGLVVLRGKELYFSLLTLGVAQLVWATAHGWQSLTGGTNGTTGVFGPEWLSPFLHPNALYWFVFGIVATCTLILYVVTRSPFGDALRGIRENRRRAEFVGLPVKRYELAAFVVAGTFGSIAGAVAVIGETQITSAQIDWTRSALALIVTLIGGTRYFLGPIAGAVFYTFVFEFILDKTVLWDTVLGIVVLVLALALPGGLVGMAHWLLAQGVVLAHRTVARPSVAAEAIAASPDGQEETHLPDLAELETGAPLRADGAGATVLAVEGTTKSFGGLVAVNDASFAVREGTIHAIIGPNGAGKTTLFNLITGLMRPDAGRVVLNGEDVTGTAPWRLVKRGLARSFQQTSLFWSLPAALNVTLAESSAKNTTRKMVGRHPASVVERSLDLLDRVGLGDFGAVAAVELSHGDQRSLELAAAVAVESRLLLLDEPTAGLSPAETRTAVALIERIAREQRLTVLFIEHDMEVVFGVADWITVLHRGAVLAEGRPAEIRRNAEVQRAYLGEVEADVGG